MADGEIGHGWICRSQTNDMFNDLIIEFIFVVKKTLSVMLDSEINKPAQYNYIHYIYIYIYIGILYNKTSYDTCNNIYHIYHIQNITNKLSFI